MHAVLFIEHKSNYTAGVKVYKKSAPERATHRGLKKN